MTVTDTVRLATIGAGRIGTHHAGLVARHIPGAALVAVADPVPGAAERLAASLGAPSAATDPRRSRPGQTSTASLITAPARAHTDLVVAAAAAGKHVFVEKPMAVTPRTPTAPSPQRAEAGVVLQVGFNRRFAPGFAAARAAVDDGRTGTPQLLRSLTRDPGPFTADPARIPQWTIFLETLIHDFDILRCLNPGAAPVRVHATADALIRPDARADGRLDTAVVDDPFRQRRHRHRRGVLLRPLYGYDVRAEVFGSGGMVTAGSGRSTDMTSLRPRRPARRHRPTRRDLLPRPTSRS